MTLTSIRAGFHWPGYSQLTWGVLPHSRATADHLNGHSITGLMQVQLIADLTHRHPQLPELPYLQE
jgi:hypothetical protein